MAQRFLQRKNRIHSVKKKYEKRKYIESLSDSMYVNMGTNLRNEQPRF